MRPMLRFLYSTLFLLALPVAVLRLLWRSRNEPGYRHHIGERFGRVHISRAAGSLVWVHAVSAGETIAAVPLVKRLVKDGVQVVVTNMTPAGRERATVLLDSEIAAGKVHVAYVPYDVPLLINRFLRSSKPDLLVLIDTELWPNLIACAAEQRIHIVLANGRLSEKSFAGYRRFMPVVKPMLDNIGLFLMQSESHVARLQALGVDAARIIACGSIKFDNTLPPETDQRVSTMKAQVGDRRVLLGASTHPGEETALLDAFGDSAFADGDWLLVLAIRHVRRADEVTQLLQARGISHQCYSEGDDVRPETRVWVIDVMGELISAYGVAEMAFVGGSLVPVGGHNMIEAAMLNVPILMGSHVENIEDIAGEFVQKNAMIMVSDATELRSALVALLNDEQRRRAMIQQAAGIVQQHQGALDTVVGSVTTRITT